MPKASPKRSLAALIAGNGRFVSGNARDTPFTPADLAVHADDQRPFAVIIGCADSRVPAEIIFDQGFGDLFVIRVAGAIVAPSQIGSAEFAAARFGTPLAVVLGHSGCGAVQATIDDLTGHGDEAPGLSAIVTRMRPAIEPLIGTQTAEALPEAALEASVRASVVALRDGSAILRGLEEQGSFQLVGATVNLSDGTVTFLND